MPLLQTAIAIIVIGVLLWLVNTYIPMQLMMKRILNAVVVIVVVVWLLRVSGIWAYMASVRI